MEPSWTSPIPQAMQQHRGSQTQKPKPAEPRDAVAQQQTVQPTTSAPPGESGRGG